MWDIIVQSVEQLSDYPPVLVLIYAARVVEGQCKLAKVVRRYVCLRM